MDVFDEPERAVDDGVPMTPVLVIASAAPPRRIIGDLDEVDVVLSALGLQIGAS